MILIVSSRSACATTPRLGSCSSSPCSAKRA